ncbi:MAG: glycerol-3-phosphate 1-O-acyltransferase PlsY [Nitrospirota bacterium]
MKALVIITLSYLLGSIPFGVLISKYKGINLKEKGSGNIGATNVLRTVGKGAAAFTLLGDLLKGSLSVFIANNFLHEPWIAFTGIAVILGHIFPVFIRFKGGKGVATTFGVVLIYSPIVAISAILLWSVVVFIFRYSSLGAVITFLFLPAIVSILDPDKMKLYFSSFISIIIILKHKDNLLRIFKGTETKIGIRL